MSASVLQRRATGRPCWLVRAAATPDADADALAPADRGLIASSTSNGGGRLSDTSFGRPSVHAAGRSRGSSPSRSSLSDTLSDTPVAPLCGKPCGRPAAGDDTATGSSRTPPSPDRLPLHRIEMPARAQADGGAVPPMQETRMERRSWRVRLPSRPRARSGMSDDPWCFSCLFEHPTPACSRTG